MHSYQLPIDRHPYGVGDCQGDTKDHWIIRHKLRLGRHNLERFIPGSIPDTGLLLRVGGDGDAYHRRDRLAESRQSEAFGGSTSMPPGGDCIHVHELPVTHQPSKRDGLALDGKVSVHRV